MVRNASRLRHSVIRLRHSVTILRHERPRRAVAGVASAAAIASVAAHTVAAHTVAAIAGDSDEGVDRLRAPQFPLHPNRIEGETGCGPGFSPPQPPAIPIAPLHREIFRAQTYANV